jgi:hypothetical protein
VLTTIVTNTLSFVFVSTLTSSDCTRVDTVPATACPMNGFTKWHPSRAKNANFPHCWITCTVPVGTHVKQQHPVGPAVMSVVVVVARRCASSSRCDGA